ncbi:MAG: hypothetical protein IJU07_01575 [Synergistaceae bacterium]|nr:hypothetical protein [Synergistaceae bacterium]
MRNFTALILVILMSASVCYASNADVNFRAENRGNIYRPDKSADKELQSLIAGFLPKFTVHTYSDDVTGLTVDYSVYLPEGYTPSAKFPAVFFIADGSSAGKNPQYSLTQGLGGLIWCRHNCVVIVPSFPSIVLDDHNGFVESDYVELTGRFVNWAVKNYGVDAERVYATGQSMGCMTFLVLSSRYPDMFTACLFVSGQWNINALRGLLGQKFAYIASAGDPKASAGMNEVIEMFTRDDTRGFTVHRNVDAENPAVSLTLSIPANFLMFMKGSTLPSLTSGEISEHMSSFDYAYRIGAVREWLLAQKKGE